MTRLRLGILLFVISWLPFAQVFLAIAHNHNTLTSEHASRTFRLIIWTAQFLIGLLGVWLAGKVAINEAREAGWKKTPGRLWRLLIHGSE